jgi:multiple sugar transport system permease protein
VTALNSPIRQISHTPRRRRRRLSPWWNTAIGIGIIALMLFPMYWMLNVSLQNAQGAVATPPFPAEFSLAGYARALRDQGGNLMTSLTVSLGSVVLSLLIATPAAYALAQFGLRGVDLMLFAILVSQMVPGIVIANALYTLYNNLGLLNTVHGLILANAGLGIPFAILILRAFMKGLPRSLLEAAQVDGAGALRVFVSIVLPLSRNGMITAALFTFLFAWGDFLFALTLTTTEDVRPVTLGIYQYLGAYVSDWSPVMATAVLASLPAVLLLILVQRYIAAGITGGAVK